MGCSPSVLLEHIHRDSAANQDKSAIKKSAIHSKKENNRNALHRKSSLALTPEDEAVDINRGPHEFKYGILLPPSRTPLKLLLVFLDSDPVSEAIIKAASKLSFETTFCNSFESALEEFQSKFHDLVIIDTRSTKRDLDFETLCRSIRNTKGSQHCVLLAVVKKSVFEKDDITVLSLLDTGFNRCLIETTNVVVCINELIQVKHSDIRPVTQYTTSQALYAALDRCKDIVIITDDVCRIQYTNRASEKSLGYRQDETFGKTLHEQIAPDISQINQMNSKLARGRDWQGQLTVKRKAQDPLNFICKAVPVTCIGRSPTYYVIVLEQISYGGEPMPLVSNQSRGSVHSIRRLSTDLRSVGSDYLRRTSLAKLSALPLEAPITKVITLIAQAQDMCGQNAAVIQTLDKVVDILRSSELYSSYMKENIKLKTEEPVASDLIGALVSAQPAPSMVNVNSRRSSNDDSSLYRSKSAGSRLKIPPKIMEILDNSLSWEFDIFRLEEMSKLKPLQHLGMTLFSHYDVANTLNTDESTLLNWLIVIEANYHSVNTYHNSTHAADVMQATANYLEKERMKSIMEPLDEATSLIAAAAHDVDHPGKSSAFLSNASNALAILYNDVTVLEMHHAALTFKLTLGDDRINIFKNLDNDMYKVARHNVIDMILATEMTKHFEHLAKFVNVFCEKPETDNENDYIPIALPENVTLVKRMMIKCADVSNPTRPLRQCVEWARRIAEEYFEQTDEEKEKGLPIVMPMFDKQTCSIPKAQIGFVDYIINDMFEAWNAFIDMPEIIVYMRQNYLKWKELDEQGHTTLGDIRKLQNTVALSPLFPSKPNKRTDNKE